MNALRSLGRFAAAATVAVAVTLLAAAAAPMAVGHSPDPAISWPLFTADDILEFRWKADEVPPLKMRDAVILAANGAVASRGSRAPSINYSADGASTVEYGFSWPSRVLVSRAV